MKTIVLLLVFCSFFYSCTSPTTSKTEREGEPDIYTVKDEDPDMNSAVKLAIQTLDTFKIALASNNEDYSSFSLKQHFDTSDGGEHIWLNEIVVKDNSFYGIVNNEPELTDEVKFGDTIKIESAKISDWMYVDRGRVKGGYTIRVLRDRMSKEEQQQFDEQTGLIFE